MIEDDKREKEYKLRQLEKLVDDQKYYMVNKKNISKFISESSGILNSLKKHELNQEEVKTVSKMVGWIEKLKRYLR